MANYSVDILGTSITDMRSAERLYVNSDEIDAALCSHFESENIWENAVYPMLEAMYLKLQAIKEHSRRTGKSTMVSYVYSRPEGRVVLTIFTDSHPNPERFTDKSIRGIIGDVRFTTEVYYN